MATTAETRTARKARRCEGYRCENTIQPGDEYARHVAFPGDEVNEGPGLWVLNVCRACVTEYGQPMPPRRTKTAAAEAAKEETLFFEYPATEVDRGV